MGMLTDSCRVMLVSGAFLIFSLSVINSCQSLQQCWVPLMEKSVNLPQITICIHTFSCIRASEQETGCGHDCQSFYQEFSTLDRTCSCCYLIVKQYRYDGFDLVLKWPHLLIKAHYTFWFGPK